eukprot:1193066-Prorocentrum_minimum.AAC.3
MPRPACLDLHASTFSQAPFRIVPCFHNRGTWEYADTTRGCMWSLRRKCALLKRGEASGVLSASLPLLAQEDP